MQSTVISTNEISYNVCDVNQCASVYIGEDERDGDEDDNQRRWSMHICGK